MEINSFTVCGGNPIDSRYDHPRRYTSWESDDLTLYLATAIFDAHPNYRIIHNNCQNFATYLLEALCPGVPVPDTISKVLQGMIAQSQNPPSVTRLPGTYPVSTIQESNSYVTASETSWWTATGTEWVTAVEYTTSAGEWDASSTIASFMRAELIEALKVTGNINIDLVIQLLDTGVDVSFTDRQGFCPLAYAVRSGNETVLRLLIKAGADVSAEMPGGIDDAQRFGWGDFDGEVKTRLVPRLMYLVRGPSSIRYAASFCSHSKKGQSTDRRISTRVRSKSLG
jgi:Ankyrin repeat